MAGWRTLRAVAPNFLSTFTSRYRDRDGWWLFGLAESSLDGITIDLLADAPGPDSAREQVVHDAIHQFRDQLQKQRVPLSLLVEATLQCRRGDKDRRIAGEYVREGHDFIVIVYIKTTTGNEITRSKQLFVSPHDPHLEHRTTQPNTVRKTGDGIARFWDRVRRLPKPVRMILLPILIPFAAWRLQLLILATAAIGTLIAAIGKLFGLLPVPWAFVGMCFIFPACLLSLSGVCVAFALLTTDGVMWILRRFGYEGK